MRYLIDSFGVKKGDEKVKLFAMLCLLAVATTFAQNSAFTDPRDGKKYKVVKIGEQTWMA